MLNLLVLLIIIFVVFMSVRMHFDTQLSEIDFVESKYDHRKYLVRNLPNKHEAAELMSLIRQRLVKLTDYLKNKYPNDDRIRRLCENFDPNQISEKSHESEYTSYSVNKGEKIVFCLRQRDETEQLMDINTMIFVAIHELAHIMTESIGHTHEFWDNMKFLLQNAMVSELKIYQYQPYHKIPKTYCGTQITDTPLKDTS